METFAGNTATNSAAADQPPIRRVRGARSSPATASSARPLTATNVPGAGSDRGTIDRNGVGAAKCRTPVLVSSAARPRAMGSRAARSGVSRFTSPGCLSVVAVMLHRRRIRLASLLLNRSPPTWPAPWPPRTSDLTPPPCSAGSTPTPTPDTWPPPTAQPAGSPPSCNSSYSSATAPAAPPTATPPAATTTTNTTTTSADPPAWATANSPAKRATTPNKHPAGPSPPDPTAPSTPPPPPATPTQAHHHCHPAPTTTPHPHGSTPCSNTDSAASSSNTKPPDRPVRLTCGSADAVRMGTRRSVRDPGRL